ncbi:hypothetical protein BWI15_23935 [Kribbella sp. ALI-6-A]|uniref:hypothetical protein n=1 Tax=Kribbella sp. ALI-6-A TaxID=1933817 RepID=UPI00097C28FB|nr:hypothetical protein [Kribbella sp. ALI-6-A]ONI69614.1 hypothetical protein BWI15_23935 [Kribbella sp. ALI-6-A]
MVDEIVRSERVPKARTSTSAHLQARTSTSAHLQARTSTSAHLQARTSKSLHVRKRALSDAIKALEHVSFRSTNVVLSSPLRTLVRQSPTRRREPVVLSIERDQRTALGPLTPVLVAASLIGAIGFTAVERFGQTVAGRSESRAWESPVRGCHPPTPGKTWGSAAITTPPDTDLRRESQRYDAAPPRP